MSLALKIPSATPMLSQVSLEIHVFKEIRTCVLFHPVCLFQRGLQAFSKNTNQGKFLLKSKSGIEEYMRYVISFEFILNSVTGNIHFPEEAAVVIFCCCSVCNINLMFIYACKDFIIYI